ncbi:hypothetical protein DAPPUDRAFT_116308 [Daphnia pulex]|uniref:Uncharacterized protein n=1 Tax=Daphnia pulex TaxID=6669 RepID=E9HNZ7_DAPPU|nr:hypothetical protein DAPPUDRAFT_116308 [Daphnia pulex]|eukprot:EFX66534.1 hypothetical protein DAPPUDRAFT_116308 [Daphnia pulex]
MSSISLSSNSPILPNSSVRGKLSLRVVLVLPEGIKVNAGVWDIVSLLEKFNGTKDKGVYGTLTSIDELPVDFFPLDSDVISMELDNVFKDLYVDNEISSLHQIAHGLTSLQSLYGIFPNVVDTVKLPGENFQASSHAGQSPRSDGSSVKSVVLNSAEELYADLRDKYFSAVDTYKGAQDKLKNAINGEQVVSTDLEKRGRGGRTEAKKRRAAVVDVVSSPSLIVKQSDSRGAASTAIWTLVNYGTSDPSDEPSRPSSVNSSTERVEILGDGSFSSSSAPSSSEDLLISKVVGEVQHAKKRSRMSDLKVVEPAVNESSSKTATNETAATKKPMPAISQKFQKFLQHLE